MKILIFTCDSIIGECFQEQHFGREGKQEWAEGEVEMYTVTTQSTDSLRICESGCPFRAVPLGLASVISPRSSPLNSYWLRVVS